jgi:hypothetical protein
MRTCSVASRGSSTSSISSGDRLPIRRLVRSDGHAAAHPGRPSTAGPLGEAEFVAGIGFVPVDGMVFVPEAIGTGPGSLPRSLPIHRDPDGSGCRCPLSAGSVWIDRIHSGQDGSGCRRRAHAGSARIDAMHSDPESSSSSHTAALNPDPALLGDKTSPEPIPGVRIASGPPRSPPPPHPSRRPGRFAPADAGPSPCWSPVSSEPDRARKPDRAGWPRGHYPGPLGSSSRLPEAACGLDVG